MTEDTSITLKVKSDAILKAYIAQCVENYVREKTSDGLAVELAREQAQKMFGDAFPGGKPAQGQIAYDIMLQDTRIGTLWIGVKSPKDPEIWWIFDIEIYGDYQRKGYGRQAMALAEESAKQHGAKVLGLNVIGNNTAAIALYTSASYEPKVIQMRKSLQ
jgi:ribosomal protein S18 acetylase RimI-like enzyme